MPLHPKRLSSRQKQQKGKSNMPKVNGKSYSYTKKGMAAAKKAAAKSGKKVSYKKKKK